VKNYAIAIESFEPFDVENYQEEIICILSILCINIPEHFNVVTMAPVLLNYTHGQQLLLGVRSSTFYKLLFMLQFRFC
jgi:hypothetical protein